MITNITVEEIKTKYRDNHGFAFICQHPVSNGAIQRLADTLISAGITTEMPLVVTRVDSFATIFIYNRFDAPTFFARAQIFEQMMGVARVVPFLEYLK